MTLFHKNQHQLKHGWTEESLPFHDGEREAQHRVGLIDKMEHIGRRAIRNWMPDQHRYFYQDLPYILIGSVDQDGAPWASIACGKPGFINSPNEYTLNIHLDLHPDDPLLHTINHTPTTPHALGLLGINMSNRRRNRVNGQITSYANDVLSIHVKQSFGNCPKYIQTRTANDVTHHRWHPPQTMHTLNAHTQALIQRSDTFFIATSHTDPKTYKREVDVSHRGGTRGFVKVDAQRLTWPDYSGNNFFNTIGNLITHPQAGYLFIDFEHADALYITTETTIIWDGPEVDSTEGAQRLIQSTIKKAIYIPALLPWTFEFDEYSPTLTSGSYKTKR